MIKDNKEYKILIVEDNSGDFLIVEELLSENIARCEMVRAVSFKEAAAILALDPGFSVVLLDLSLPDKSGQELVSSMLKITAECCPVIILTGYADMEFSIRSISEGIFDYLLKDDLTATALYKSILYAIERKKNIFEIAASEKRYSDLFNLSPQPMWVFDAVSFRFVQVNQATIDLYGYSAEEFLGMSVLDLKQKEDIVQAKTRMSKPHFTESVVRQTVRHRKKSGEIIEVEIFGNPIVINGKTFKSVIAIDVTEKNLLEHRITKAIIKTQEDERYEIGSELHDNVCQILAATQLSFSMVKPDVLPGSIQLFEQGREYISMVLDEIRNLSHRLAPAFFDNINLEEAFRKLFRSFDPAGIYTILLHIDGELESFRVHRDIQLNIYRILQEQLRNIFKYAHAKVITVQVKAEAGNLVMTIADDGIGFNTEASSTGIGFANMKRRAELFSGKLQVMSLQGEGCKITVQIPLKEFLIVKEEKTVGSNI